MMRINRFIASSMGTSRRAADELIAAGHVKVNGQNASAGQEIIQNDNVTLSGKSLSLPQQTTTIMLNKPVGFVCSRVGQGSKTIYDLLPPELHNLKPVGRLDKDSSGLILLSNDGQLAHRLTHPSFQKEKLYKISLNKSLSDKDKRHIEKGLALSDGISSLKLEGENKSWLVTMSEGRNRQIRRTFSALNYTIRDLRRIQFGSYMLGDLKEGQYLHI